MPSLAAAQSWVEFRDPAWGAEIKFPLQPIAEDIEYTGFADRAAPGRLFSVHTETGLNARWRDQVHATP